MDVNQTFREHEATLSFDAGAWQRLLKRGIVLKEAQDIHEYQRRFRDGVNSAIDFLSTCTFVQMVSAECLRQVHELMFKGIHSDAGLWRDRYVTAGLSSPADHRRLLEELALRELQVLSLSTVGTIDHSVLASVFAHVRAKCIQPFLDGNKRSSRIISSAMICSLTSKWPTWGTRENYYRGLKESQMGDLSTLLNIVRISIALGPLPGPVRAPFRTRAFLVGDGIFKNGMSLEELFRLSRV